MVSMTGFLLPVQVNMRSGGVESEANVTDIHEALHFDITEHPDEARCWRNPSISSLITVISNSYGSPWKRMRRENKD